MTITALQFNDVYYCIEINRNVKSKWQSRRTWAHLLLWELKNCNLLLNNHQQKHVGSHQKKKKDNPCPRTKEKSQKDGRRGEILFRIKSQTQQRWLEGSNKTMCIQGDRTETELDLHLSVRMSPAEVQVSSGLPQGQGLWMQQTSVWHKPSWSRLLVTSPQSCQNLHRIGETDSWRVQKNLVCTRTQEKGILTPKETDPDLLVGSRSLQWRHGSVVACCRVRCTECGSVCMGPFEKVTIASLPPP